MTENKQYSPSWLNRLTDWLDSLPIPVWLIYLVAIIVLGFIFNLVEWEMNLRPAGVFDIERSTDGIYPIFFIAFFQYLNNTAKKTLYKFQPLLDADETSYANLEYKISVFPAHWAWLILGLAALMNLSVLIDGFQSGHVYATSVLFIFFVFVTSAMFIQIFQTFRQIRLITQLQKEVKKISLFHLGPIHAFSELTSKIGMGLVFIVVFGVIQIVYMNADVRYAILHVFLLFVAAIAFVLPLRGMRDKLLEEQGSLLDKMDYQIERLFFLFNQASKDDDLVKIEEYSNALQAQRVERAALKQVSMWPWETRTLRGFASTFLVPVLLWVVTRLLESIF